MKTALTGSLVVCVAAAGIAVGALTLEAGGDADPAPATQPGAPTSGAPTGSPYGGAGAVPGAAPAAGAAAAVEISDFTFSASAAAPGASVAVSNGDGFPHTVTADDGSFDSGTVDAGASGGFVAPTASGTYSFHCEIHPQMNGTLTVG